MAEETIKIKAKIKKGKKSFYEVSTPLTSSKVHVYGASMEEFEGKVVKLDLTRSLKGKSCELRLRVHFANGKLESEPVSFQLVGSYIRRVMRGGIDYAEDSFPVECRDVFARIKPFMITRKRVSRNVLNTLRVNAKKFLESYLKVRDYNEIFSEIMSNKLQRQLFTKLKKIYPLALCEIRMFVVERKKSADEIKETKVEMREEFVQEEVAEVFKTEEKKEEAKEEKVEKKEEEKPKKERKAKDKD